MYKVTIEQIETVVKPAKQWLRQHDGPSTEGQYAYVEADLPTLETRTLLHQVLDSIDLPAVIKAINGL